VYGGYCYLNNVAIGAQWLTDKGQRVAILDVDYHHGNGTQQIFYDRADVLFCSIHADPAVEYPYFVGYADEVGKNATSGASIFTNYNYPLPRGTAEPEYFVALDQAIQQIADFAPDTLLISLGFDTLEGDPVGGFALQTDSFQRMAERISALHLPTILVQEGGYALDLLGQNLTAFLHGFLAE
jgi:acetoin utilization deacetylase AcuC-like enzyme